MICMLVRRSCSSRELPRRNPTGCWSYPSGRRSWSFREEQGELHASAPVFWTAVWRLDPVAGTKGNLKDLRSGFKQLCHVKNNGHSPRLIFRLTNTHTVEQLSKTTGGFTSSVGLFESSCAASVHPPIRTYSFPTFSASRANPQNHTIWLSDGT